MDDIIVTKAGWRTQALCVIQQLIENELFSEATSLEQLLITLDDLWSDQHGPDYQDIVTAFKAAHASMTAEQKQKELH